MNKNIAGKIAQIILSLIWIGILYTLALSRPLLYNYSKDALRIFIIALLGVTLAVNIVAFYSKYVHKLYIAWLFLLPAITGIIVLTYPVEISNNHIDGLLGEIDVLQYTLGLVSVPIICLVGFIIYLTHTAVLNYYKKYNMKFNIANSHKLQSAMVIIPTSFSILLIGFLLYIRLSDVITFDNSFNKQNVYLAFYDYGQACIEEYLADNHDIDAKVIILEDVKLTFMGEYSYKILVVDNHNIRYIVEYVSDMTIKENEINKDNIEVTKG